MGEKILEAEKVFASPIPLGLQDDVFAQLENFEIVDTDEKASKQEAVKEDEESKRVNNTQQFWKIGCSLEELEAELESLLTLFERGFVSKEDFERRRNLILAALPQTSKLAEAWTAEETESGKKASLSSFLILDGKKTNFDTLASRSAFEKNPREVRVFLSSTFVDMQQERDALLKFAFPQLRKFCEERGLHFVEVDLRWGITSEESSSGDVVKICLEEIEKCNYFVNMLGWRYGWIPQSFPQQLKQKYKWLSQIPEGHYSITHLECLHGALNNLKNAERFLPNSFPHFFFFLSHFLWEKKVLLFLQRKQV